MATQMFVKLKTASALRLYANMGGATGRTSMVPVVGLVKSTRPGYCIILYPNKIVAAARTLKPEPHDTYMSRLHLGAPRFKALTALQGFFPSFGEKRRHSEYYMPFAAQTYKHPEVDRIRAV